MKKAGRFEVRSSRFLELRTQNYELRIAPVTHVLLVSLTIHERRFTRKRGGSAIAAEMPMNNRCWLAQEPVRHGPFYYGERSAASFVVLGPLPRTVKREA